MAFGNITTFYLPIAGSAGASQWGSDVRKLLDSADGTADETTRTAHGTGGAVTRTHAPYTTNASDLTQADYGWAVTPSDMNSVSGARRFIRAGDHTVTARIRDNGVVGKTGCRLDVFCYRVGPTPTFTRTLLDSWSSASFDTPAAGAYITVTATKSLAEILLEADETVQYSFELNAPGTAITGVSYWFATGTQGGVEVRIDHQGLETLADGAGTITGSATVAGVTGKVLGAAGTVTGDATIAAPTSSVWSTDGAVTGTATIAGVPSTRWDSAFTGTGDATVLGKPSIVLGTDFEVDTGGSGGSNTYPRSRVVNA